MLPWVTYIHTASQHRISLSSRKKSSAMPHPVNSSGHSADDLHPAFCKRPCKINTVFLPVGRTPSCPDHRRFPGLRIRKIAFYIQCIRGILDFSEAVRIFFRKVRNKSDLSLRHFLILRSEIPDLLCLNNSISLPFIQELKLP